MKLQQQRQASKYVASALLALLLAACTTLGPDYAEVDPQWLADWQPDLYGQLDTAAASVSSDLTYWWRRFNDPDLDALVTTTLQENPNLQIAGLRILEARARLGGAEALRLPQVQQITASAAQKRRNDDLQGRVYKLESDNKELALCW